MNFRGKDWSRHGNHYTLADTSIRVYFWNSGKNANFMVEAGTTNADHINVTIHGKGPEARDAAITTAYNLREKYTLTPQEIKRRQAWS